MRWLACIAFACALGACGDDGGGGGGGIGTNMDGGPDGGDRERDASDEPSGSGGGGGGRPPPERDAAVDAEPFDPFDYDAAGDYTDGGGTMTDPGPPPAEWSCPAALWNDGYCDCGCAARDVDCTGFSCIEPGCVPEGANACEACFTMQGAWTSCASPPDADEWLCVQAKFGDALCDCGCGIPDPACQGEGCSEPGCHKSACDCRHGCTPERNDLDDQCPDVTAAFDLCEGDNPPGGWQCAWDQYGSGDGCHCGCGVIDPDCNGAGCTAARCFEDSCDHCNDGENDGRPYSCEAAAAGWDDDVVPAAGSTPSLCDALRFGAGDGCDCGCGGRDPDCGDEGCDDPGCIDAACVRCTDPLSRQPQGCAPATWIDGEHNCNPANYGTGDGCDCGCGVPDPDCGDTGCTDPGCTDAACDVCNGGTGLSDGIRNYTQCPGWTCTDANAFSSGMCDCGCGVIDPACRGQQRVDCTEAGCETPVCQLCNDGDERTACGGQWQGYACNVEYYGDGLCDCGCGAPDPDCADGEGCAEPGCVAIGCDVCRTEGQPIACNVWTCDAAALADGEVCDCGCGAPDPDCGAGAGCKQPGCAEIACETCHDPLGRAVPCPL